MPTTITSNTPLVINGAPFTGLMYLSPGPGQSGWCSGCCNSGDCYAVQFENGIYQGGFIKGAGKCVAEFTMMDPTFFEATADGSYYKLGYKWGDPDALLSNLCVDGCCASMELELPEGTVDFSDFENYIKPKGSLRLELATALARVAELEAQITEQAGMTVTEIEKILAAAVPIHVESACVGTSADSADDCNDCDGPLLGR